MIKFEPFALKFTDKREAELVAEALHGLRCDNAPDALLAKAMVKLIDKELEGGGP
ncbi:MAG: hypothetical protein WKF79_00175 [Nocardioides sp.]